MVRGVIFDMDGLMFDTERMWDTFWPPVCARLGLPEPPKHFYSGGRGLAGANLLRHVEEFFPGQDAQRLIDLTWQQAAEAFSRPVPCKPGLKELLQWLQTRGIPCAVASSSPIAMVRRNLENTGTARYIAAVTGGEEVTHSKPDPEIFLLAAGRLGVPIAECLILEDSHNGVRAGRAAGAKVIMVPDLMPVTDEMRRLYDFCCPDLFAVRDLLAAERL